MKTIRLRLAILALLALPAFAAAAPQHAQEPAPRNAALRGNAEQPADVDHLANPMPEGTLALASMGMLALGAARRRMKA